MLIQLIKKNLQKNLFLIFLKTLKEYMGIYNHPSRTNIWEYSTEGWKLRKFISTFIQIAQTLDYAHSKGVVHRDIKPQNIMIGEFGEVLIVDWGLAKVDSWADTFPEKHPNKVVVPLSVRQLQERMGSISGTPLYMPPEQILRPYLQQDHRCDIYAMGVMLFELLLGERAFKGDYKSIFKIKKNTGDCTYTAQMEKRLQENPNLDTRIRTIPEDLLNILRRCLYADRDHRYDSAGQLADALQDWIDGADRRQKALDCLEDISNYKTERKALFNKAKHNREKAIKVLELTNDVEGCWDYITAGEQNLKSVLDYDFSVKQTIAIGMMYAPTMIEFHKLLIEIEHKEYLRMLLDGEKIQSEFLRRKVEHSLRYLPHADAMVWRHRFNKGESFTKLYRRMHGRLVGRVSEKISLYPLYTSERIITIVGESGTGKTHLMLHTLFDRIVDSGEEVIYCDMSHTFNHFCLAQQILLALDMKSTHTDILDEIGEYLSKMPGVYIAFDNAEWNPETLQKVLPILLEKAPNLTAVITSREPLGLEQESVVRLNTLCEVDAMKLFHHHATNVDPDFEVCHGDHQRILDIVNAFECVPMAIKTIASKIDQFSLQRIHRMVLDNTGSEHPNSLDTALLFIWMSLPNIAKDTVIQLLWFRRLFAMEIALYCIDSSESDQHMSPIDAIKILKNEQWVIASSNALFNAHYIQPSIVDFIQRQAEAHPNLSSMQQNFFERLGTYFVKELGERNQEEQFRYIPGLIENMLLAVEHSPLPIAQVICDTLATYFEVRGPVSRGETMVKMFAMRVGIETGEIQIDPADYPSLKDIPIKDK